MASESLLKYGLENSLRDYCRNISQPGEFSVSFEALGTATMQLTDEQSFHIFRIIQELIQNIIKHAGTTQALLQISYNEHKLYITVEDNGKGFILTDPQHKKGIGLKNIESRIKALKGKMDFRTAPNEGTSVLIEIPC
jgi:signal transduction histidine kinase